MNPYPFIRKTAIGLVGKPIYNKFNKSSLNLKDTQESILKNILDTCKETAFGKKHGFDSIKTPADYRNALPITDYEYHRPYIDRMRSGETDVLFPGKPLMYNVTSGTTDKPKLIPIFKDHFENEYSSLSRLWFYTILRDNPSIFQGKSFSAVSPAIDGYVEDGTPFGSISGVTYQNIPSILKSTYSTPYSIICIKDYIKKYYAMMRYALGCNITYIVCPSPSNIIRFNETVNENIESLIKDIHDGTLKDNVAAELHEKERKKVLSSLKPDRPRARRLEKLAAAHDKKLLPKHYWPDLACVNLWKQGNFSRLIPTVKNYFPDTASLRAFGYYASEARGGMVLGNDWEYSVLSANSYYFEFIEQDAKENGGHKTIGAHEVEKGKIYYIIISNCNGLYRYDINDIVEITGYYNEFPLFKFIQKGEGIGNVTGEKLSEEQINNAVDFVSEKESIDIKHYIMFCNEEKLQYTLFTEFPADTSKRKKNSFIRGIDKRLKETNNEYEKKRGTKRLSAPLLKELCENSRARLKEELIIRGMAKDGQYKESHLRKKPVFLELLTKLSQ